MSTLNEIIEALNSLSIPEKIVSMSRFFKTGEGQYGEGDQFIGVSVPDQRKVAKSNFSTIELDELGKLLSSKVHEHRLTALIILVLKFEKTKSLETKKELIDFYIHHLDYVNNWDLVDTSCYKLLGRFCFEIENTDLIVKLSNSEVMWHKRIAVVSTLYFIKKHSFELTKTLVEKDMKHPHDLMQKANGWMLREMGEQNYNELILFLNQFYQMMPRTTLRYAIEKLDPSLRKDYLAGKI